MRICTNNFYYSVIMLFHLPLNRLINSILIVSVPKSYINTILENFLAHSYGHLNNDRNVFHLTTDIIVETR